MEIRSLMIAIVVFSGVFTGMSTFYVDFIHPENLHSYGLNTTEVATITSYFNENNISQITETDTITDKTERIKEALTNTDNPYANVPLVGDVYRFLLLGYAGIQIPLESVNTFQNIASNVDLIPGIPSWIIGIIITVILVMIVFAVMSAFLKWKV